jgi:hypothetical protein
MARLHAPPFGYSTFRLLARTQVGRTATMCALHF